MAFRHVVALSLLNVALSDMEVTYPTLSGEAVLTKGSPNWWHMGGFCFGVDQSGAPVARLKVHMLWTGDKPLDESTKVYFTSFDGRDDKWGAARPTWEESSCQEKLAVATDYFLISVKPNSWTGMAIHVLQATAHRDWHYALLACSPQESGTFQVRMQAVQGALSIFPANENFDSSSCPVFPQRWWEHAAGNSDFWFLLLATALSGILLSLSILCLRRFPLGRAQVMESEKNSKVQTESSPVSPADVVIGKPCETKTDMAKQVNEEENQVRPHEVLIP